MKSIVSRVTDITNDFNPLEAGAAMLFVGLVTFMYVGVPIWVALMGAASYIIAMPYEVTTALALPFGIALVWRRLYDWSHNGKERSDG